MCYIEKMSLLMIFMVLVNNAKVNKAMKEKMLFTIFIAICYCKCLIGGQHNNSMGGCC